MESLPTEILDHIFYQFPNKCEICQEKCLRSSLRQELSKCSKTSERWNRITEEKVKEFEQLNKCYSEFENVYAVTHNIQPEERPIPIIQTFNRAKTFIHFNSDSLLAIWRGYLILQVNEFIMYEEMDLRDTCEILTNAQNLQSIRFVLGQKKRDQICNEVYISIYHSIVANEECYRSGCIKCEGILYL